MADILLAVRHLTKKFPVRGGFLARRQWLTAVDDVSFEIPRGSTLALVGESGSGKSTIGLMLMDLLAPTGGEIIYGGKNLTQLRGRERLRMRREMQVVFQDPYASLNARLTVRETLTEGMAVHGIGADAQVREGRAAALLEQVGLSPRALDRYPHEFSGGQRQRIAIGRALSVGPQFIVLDEPTSALDVSIQSQILNLLRGLQREHGLTYLFVTHNLGVVEYLADAVTVLEHGRIVESGTVQQIFDHPQQDYTRQLLNSIPSLNPRQRRLTQATQS